MYPRLLALDSLLQHRSVFLFGPRQTGKTSYLRERYPSARYFNLLDTRTYREQTAHPESVRRSLTPEDKLLIIDEIQKLPALLDEVQLLIGERKELRCILTGSSARKLKRGAANLLGGRALVAKLHPLVSSELGSARIESRVLHGSLPPVVDSPFPFEDLSAYVGVYLREEVTAEGLSRNIEGFSRFLEVAALRNGDIVNFTSLASDVGLSPRTVQNYYAILEDTLLGFQLPPYRRSRSAKSFSSSKFYFFDPGVVSALVGRTSIASKTKEFGDALEHLIFVELRAYLDYARSHEALSFWRSRKGHEVDFVIGDRIGIEVKAKERYAPRDTVGLRKFAGEFGLERKILVTNGEWTEKTEHGVDVIPVEKFLSELWSGKVVPTLEK